VSDNPELTFFVRDDDGNEGEKYDDCGVCRTTLKEMQAKDDTIILPLVLRGEEAGTFYFKWRLQ
jgi:hypothetical protein